MSLDAQMPIDRMIEAFWDLCRQEWYFWLGSDQWFGMWASCPHGRWEADSQGALDPSTAIIVVYDQAAAVSHASGDP